MLVDEKSREGKCTQGHIMHDESHSVGYGGSGKSTELQVKAASVTDAMKGPR